MRNVIRNISLAFVLACFGMANPLTATETERICGNTDLFADYYTFLARIAPFSPDAQIQELKSFIQEHPLFERPYHQLLALYFENDQLDEAESYFKDQLALPERQRNSGWALSSLAAARDSSQIAFQRLKSLLQEEQASPYLLLEFADYFTALAPKASFEFEDVLASLPLKPADRHIALAFYYSNMPRYEQCRLHLEQIPDNEYFKLYALHSRAFMQHRQGNLLQAEALYREGLEAAKALGDEPFYTQNLVSLALQIYNTQPAEAIDYGKEALERAKHIHDVDRIIAAHEALARIFLQRQDFANALHHARQARDMASAQFHRRSLARLHILLGQIYARSSSPVQALEHYEQSLFYSKKANATSLRITALRIKGDLYMALNLYDLASHDFLQALQLADSSAYPLDYNITLIDWAAQLYETNNFGKSRELLLKTIHAGHLETAHLVYAYFHLATCYEMEKKFDLALATYEKVCEIVDENFDNEFIHYYKALALPQRAAIETQFGHYDKADSLLAEPIIQKQMQQRPGLKIDYFSNLAYLRFHQRNYDRAVEHYLTAANFVENFREKMDAEHFRIGFYGQTSDVYRKLVSSLYARYDERKEPSDLEHIFSALQKCSGRSLQDLTPKKRKTEYSPEYINAVDSLQHLQRRLRDSVWKQDAPITAELHERLDVARHVLLNQRGLMLDKTSLSKPGEISLHDVQRVCRDNNLNVLFYHISDSLSFVFVVQPDSLALVHLTIRRDSLKAQIFKLMAPLHHATEAQLESIPFRAGVAHDLYREIVQPITDKISLAENLFIIPGMDVLNLPFEMLLTKAPRRNTYTPTDSADYAPLFLQHHHQFTYSPTLTPLFETPIQSNSIIVFSNPTFYDTEMVAALNFRSALRSIFVQLPHADKEAQQIAETSHALRIRGDDVTKAAVLQALKKYDIVHIATHAFVDSVFDAYSGLALATLEEQDDGLLMGYELQDLSLNNDLVVLSACESGGGKFVAGEGVLGLPRLFLRAGVRSVLMSLWKVHDPFPAHMMPVFYDYYKNQHKTKAQALALAKRQVLLNSSTGELNYKHPFFWATFCLYGSPGLTAKPHHHFIFWAMGLSLMLAVAVYTFYKQRHAR